MRIAAGLLLLLLLPQLLLVAGYADYQTTLDADGILYVRAAPESMAYGRVFRWFDPAEPSVCHESVLELSCERVMREREWNEIWIVYGRLLSVLSGWPDKI